MDSGVAEAELFFRQKSSGGFDQSGRFVTVAGSGFGVVGGDETSRGHGFDSFRMGVGLACGGLDFFEFGMGSGNLDLVGKGIKVEEGIVFFDSLIVLNVDLEDLAGNAGCDPDDIGQDIGIVAGGVVLSIEPSEGDKDEGRAGEEDREEGAF